MPDRLHNFQSDYRMVLRGIRPNDEYAIGVPEFGDGISHGSAAEGCGQTGHGWRMSETGTVVDIVSAQNRPGKLLHQVVLLVGTLGRG